MTEWYSDYIQDIQGLFWPRFLRNERLTLGSDGIWPKIYAYWLSQFILISYGLFLALGERKPKALKESPQSADVAPALTKG